MKIERPNVELLTNSIYHDDRKILFNEWFNKNVEPINEMLNKAIKVYSNFPSLKWYPTQMPEEYDFKQEALLINIQPIKKETAEDVLKEFVDFFEDVPKAAKTMTIPSPNHWNDLLYRAKALLEED